MIQDLLIPSYEENEYGDIPYDLIYTSQIKIPTRNELTSFNEIIPKESCLCMNSFYNNSKYCCLFLFLLVASTVGIVYIVIYTK